MTNDIYVSSKEFLVSLSGNSEMTTTAAKEQYFFSVKKDWDTDNYPSKGFPRVTVNVPLYETGKITPALIYMGETLSIESIVKGLIDAANDNECFCYWEYLERLGEVYDDIDLFAPPKEILEAGENGLEETVPLPLGQGGQDADGYEGS